MHACQHAQQDDDEVDDDDDDCDDDGHYDDDDGYDDGDKMMTTMMTVIHLAALITPYCVALASASVLPRPARPRVGSAVRACFSHHDAAA